MGFLMETKSYKEVQKLKEFFDMLEKNEMRAAYGEKEVLFSNQQSSIKDLLICDKLLKNNDYKKRKLFEKLVEEVESQKGNVFIFSSNHSSGQRLIELSGIAAILKFEIDLDNIDGEDLDQENEDEDEIEDMEDF